MIYTVFKTTFKKLPPKLIKYRCYKKFVKADFERELLEHFNEIQNIDYTAFQKILNSFLKNMLPQNANCCEGTTSLL